MKQYHLSKHQTFYCVGTNYQKADAAVRGQFSLNTPQIEQLLSAAKAQGIDGLLVISTCNRTELFGFAPQSQVLVELLCAHSGGSVDEFLKASYCHKNRSAIDHLFQVGTGLDSQILGDFEIIAQVKSAFKQARQAGLANPFIERLCNAVIQASKRIKNETEISSGAASVSFASVQYILNHVPDIDQKKILLFGTGKIGRNTCENLIKHTPNTQITLINRTKDKAEQLGAKLHVAVKDHGQLPAEIRNADVLVVATGAVRPTISKEIVFNKKPLLILDLSVPKNVDANVLECADVRLVHLDELSQITDETLERRKAHVPQAQEIIAQVQQEFNQWLETRRFAPVIQALKAKLKTMQEEELDFVHKKNGGDAQTAVVVSDRLIQKITKQFAEHLKHNDTDPQQSLAVIQQVFKIEEIHG
mgnify:CR=1 FL=1|jgi:glutamyl-tRNA reductase